jgi:hypothetical protein
MSEERVYTLTLKQLAAMLIDAEDGVKICRGMLEHYLVIKKENYACALLAELYWTNYNITEILENEIEDPVEAGKGQIAIEEKPLAILQALMFSKEMASQELTKLSISTSLN